MRPMQLHVLLLGWAKGPYVVLSPRAPSQSLAFEKVIYVLLRSREESQVIKIVDATLCSYPTKYGLNGNHVYDLSL